VRLHAAVERAAVRGADFVLTNADHETVRDLYAQSFRLESVERGSEMAGKTAYRGKTTELIVTPWPNVAKVGAKVIACIHDGEEKVDPGSSPG
jgi:hypothetical protein